MKLKSFSAYGCQKEIANLPTSLLFQGSLLADADADGMRCGEASLCRAKFVLLFCFVNIHSGCFKSNHQPRSEGGIVFTNVRLCVCPDIFVCLSTR